MEATFNSKRNKALLIMGGILCLSVIIIPAILSYHSAIWMDSGIILKEMEEIAAGHTPYHTMHLNYPPLYFYWMVAMKWAFFVPYGCYEAYLTINYILLFSIGYFVYVISRRALSASKIVALFTSWLCVLTLLGFYGAMVLFEIPSIFWGFASMVLILKYSKNVFCLIIAGCFSSFAFLTKQFGAGFILLNAYVLLFLTSKSLKYKLLYYATGVFLPLFSAYVLFGKPLLDSTLFNGYGTTTTALTGMDVSLLAKLKWITLGCMRFFFFLPLAFGILFFPAIIKAGRWKELVLCLAGLFGFCLQFYFIYPGSNHYLQYMAPFAVMLLPVLLSAKLNKVAFYALSVLVCITIGWSVKLTLDQVDSYTRYVGAQQRINAWKIQENIPEGKTLYIANTGLLQYYYLTKTSTPNMKEVGYSAGPYEVTIAKATMQVRDADYVLCYYDTSESPFLDYYFTKELKREVYSHPSVEIDGKLRLYKLKE